MTASVNRRARRLGRRLPVPVKRRVLAGHKLIRKLRRLGAMTGAVVLTSIFPPIVDRPLATATARAFVLVRPESALRKSAQMTKTLGGKASDWSSAASSYWRMRVEVRWARARGAGLRADTPHFIVQGSQHLHEARASGNGIVLWRMPFTMPTPLNASVQEAGVRLVHLTSKEHMVEDGSWLSRRVIGPLNTRDEARFTDRRIVRSSSGTGGYLADLSAELREGAAVTIVGFATVGRASVTAPVGRVDVKIPTGAPSLAFSTGAALIPCTAVREGPFRWKVLFLAPIEPEPGQTRRAFRTEACQRFAAAIEDVARAEPASATFWGRSD